MVAPAEPAEAPPTRFPWVATIAPVIVAVALWLITGSMFALIFAALGPVTAIASVVDGRLAARRTRRREAARALTDRVALHHHLDEVHEAERGSRRIETPAAPAIIAGAAPVRAGVVSLGLGDVAVDLAIEGADRSTDAEVVALGRQAGILGDGPVEAELSAGIGIVAPRTLAGALQRSLAIQVAAQLDPLTHSATGIACLADRIDPGSAESAAIEFRHRSTGELVARIAAADHIDGLPSGLAVVVTSGHGQTRIVRHPERGRRGLALQTELVSERDAARWALPRVGTTGREVPPNAALTPLLTIEASSSPGLACSPAVDADGPVIIDLVADGPHAIVGGTTGSGKSELLIAWMLALAAAHPPEKVNLLLIDFKGGATFAPLETLAHTVGIITDLDHGGAQRALESLAAEIRSRERMLAAEGAREISGSSLPRLVIVVDEFAAMLDQHPELPSLFVDLASRGRSLGIHLVLATQRPAGVVRDSLLANADLRISLRVNNAADSTAVVGTPEAAGIAATQRGRAILRTAAAPPRAVQFALAAQDDVARVASTWSPAVAVRRPWCPPLPTRIAWADLPTAEGLPFGLLDEPDEQRQVTASWDGRTGLLVLGSARSGLTTTLATLGHAIERAGSVARWMPSTRDAAWDLIDDLVGALDRMTPGSLVVLIDDLDALLARFEGEHRAAVIESLARILREGPSQGIIVAAAAQRVAGETATLAGALPQRLLLQQSSRQELVLAGGEGRHFDAASPPGSGWWRGCRVQVAETGRERPADPLARVASLTPGRPLAVVSTRPDALAARLTGSVTRVDELTGAPELGAGDILLGDVDAWQSRWGLIASLRGRAEVILEGCTLADVRLITRSRRIPPPLAPRFGLAWRLSDDGAFDRVRLPFAPEPEDSERR